MVPFKQKSIKVWYSKAWFGVLMWEYSFNGEQNQQHCKRSSTSGNGLPQILRNGLKPYLDATISTASTCLNILAKRV